MWKFKMVVIWGSLLIFETSEADTIPVNNTNLNVKFDKRNIPESLYIWNALLGGDSPDNPRLFGRNTLTCLSTSDTNYGACPVLPIWWEFTSSYPKNKANISLKFCLSEEECKDINIQAYHSNTIMSGTYPSYVAVGPLDYNYGKGFKNKFTYEIPRESLSTLSSGIWKATLKQQLIQWDPYRLFNTWTADITLTVTDIASQTIFFPAFPAGSPQVDLNLSNRSSGSSMLSGTANLDMCLYDGGIAANNITLTFRDEGKAAPGRKPGAFSVYRDGAGATKVGDRIDYDVRVVNPLNGNADSVSNGTKIEWVGAAASSFKRRQVMLPGVPGASWCVPAPVTLVTPPFTLADKVAGHYKGVLTVIYTPNTTSS